MAMVVKRARAMAAKGMAMAARVAGNKMAMAMATKKAMATNGDNTGNGYGKEGGGHSTAATMGMAQRKWPLVQRLERGG